ncbi:MAG TPA: CoA transferase [Ramlibacter sp.]|nr:CoA transferase [Ramlibacter sp.]
MQPERTPPLHDIRVLDLSMFTPGPFATQILADLGATVLKVEAPPGGDRERQVMPAYFNAYNRGKGSIALDLKQPADLALCLDLAADAHVLIEGFRPGVVNRLGVGFDAVTARNPSIIYASLSGFGNEGPFAQARAHDPEIQAITGSMHYAKDINGKPYYNFAYPTFDYAAAMYAVIGILSWLGRPGHGPVHLEVPLAAAGVAWMYPQYVNVVDFDNRAFADNNLWRGAYRTADGRYITLTPAEGLASLAQVLGLEGITGRGKEDMARIADAIAQRNSKEIVPLLTKAGVPVGLVQNVDEAITDPAVQSLGLLHQGVAGLACGSPILGMPTRLLRDVPKLDAHGDAVRNRGWAAFSNTTEELR